MSSHREAPETSKDPVADSTDVYAFRSPDKPGYITLIANYIPFEAPDGGPNFYEFGDDVRYRINISHGGGARADVIYEFRFTTKIRNNKTFLYNTGPIKSLGDKNWNRPQFYSVTRYEGGRRRLVGSSLACPPVNIGPRSTPNYSKLAAAGVHPLQGGGKVFAGQRADAFHVDLGSVFDLAGLRPFNQAHAIPLTKMDGINTLQGFNVHTLAIQVPIAELVPGRVPTRVDDPHATIGVWTSAYRQRSRVIEPGTGTSRSSGPFVQVSRLGSPLFNELLVPLAEKDRWNARTPSNDFQFAKYVDKPELAALLPVLYPTVFPKLAKYSKKRADLDAILLTGIPKGVVPGFQNYTGATKADMLRLNVAVPPTAPADANPIGLVAGDAAGFPNGRRVIDDVVTIELRAVAGLTIPLVDKSYTPDDAASAVTDGTSNTNTRLLDHFPYLGLPGGGYQTKPGTASVA